jgi:glycosyltransferase involved in cell wall biosynthesis
MKVSLITACYNSARTIAHTIRSVSSQTYRDIEHILVDGGSTDHTLDIIDAQRESISKLIHGPDKGIYDALNKGLAASTGDIIAFLHADDIYASNDVIERVVDEFLAHSVDAIYGNVAFVRDDDFGRVIRVYSSERFRPSRIAWGWMPAHPALFLSRKVFEKFGRFKTDYTIAADFEFVARIFSTPNFKYRYLPRVLVKMRMGGISTKGWRSTVTLNKEVLRACRENGISSNYLKILSKYPAKALEFLISPRRNGERDTFGGG